MNPNLQDDIDTAAEYERAAAQMLSKGDVWGAEYLLAYADELHEKADKEQEAAA